MNDNLDILAGTREHTLRAEPNLSTSYLDGLGALGFNLFDPIDLFGGEKKKDEAKAEAARQEAEKKKAEAIAALVFCPKGQKPNPEYTSVPVEARGQAQAAGITACIPADEKDGKGKAKCYFQAGAKKYPCNQDGANRAAAHARALAKKGGKPRYVLFVTTAKGEQTIRLARCVVPVPMPAGQQPAVGPTPGFPATPGGGCPPNTTLITGPQGMMCVPVTAGAGPGGGPATPAAEAAGGGGRGGRRRKGGGRRRGRRRLHGLDGIGCSPELGCPGDMLGDVVPMAPPPDPIRLLQASLRKIGARDAKGELPNVTGRIDASTVQSYNKFRQANGQMPVTIGEILVNLDRVLAQTTNVAYIGTGSGLQGAQLGDLRRIVMNSMRQQPGNPYLPPSQFKRCPPNLRIIQKPIRAASGTYSCPDGYFMSDRGCISKQAIGTGCVPVERTRGQAMQADLRRYDLGPTFPNPMLRRTVPTRGVPGITLADAFGGSPR